MECQMPVVNCPHEQIAGHLADAHTRISRKPTVCLVGPEGFANAVPAMLEAAGERSPGDICDWVVDIETTGCGRI
jgi:acetolactate synthase-1/2/3 large subunit